MSTPLAVWRASDKAHRDWWKQFITNYTVRICWECGAGFVGDRYCCEEHHELHLLCRLSGASRISDHPFDNQGSE